MACSDKVFACGFAESAAQNCGNETLTFKAATDYVMDFQKLPDVDGSCKTAPRSSNCIPENGTDSTPLVAPEQLSYRTERIAIGVPLGVLLAIALFCIALLIQLLLRKRQEIKDLRREYSPTTEQHLQKLSESKRVFELHSEVAKRELP
jgi:hypothetical protein